MKIATLQDLFDADDSLGCEAPEDFNRQEALTRIQALRPALERLTGLSFEIDDHVEDASFFADIISYDPVARELLGGGRCIEVFLAVRFSAFHDLFSIWAYSSVRPLTDDERSRVAELVSSAGFLYAPPELLAQPYTGTHPDLLNAEIRDWWTRFFDYL
jgi:hypothetical protein